MTHRFLSISSFLFNHLFRLCGITLSSLVCCSLVCFMPLQQSISTLFLDSTVLHYSMLYFRILEENFKYPSSTRRCNKECPRVAASDNWMNDVYLGDINFTRSSFPHDSTARVSNVPNLNVTAGEHHHHHERT